MLTIFVQQFNKYFYNHIPWIATTLKCSARAFTRGQQSLQRPKIVICRVLRRKEKNAADIQEHSFTRSERSFANGWRATLKRRKFCKISSSATKKMTLKYLFNRFTNIFLYYLIMICMFSKTEWPILHPLVERHSFGAKNAYRSTSGFHVKKILPVVRSVDTRRLVINFKLYEKNVRNIGSHVDILVQLFYNHLYNHIPWIVSFWEPIGPYSVQPHCSVTPFTRSG